MTGYRYRYAVAPWRLADVAQHDLEPAGGEYRRDHHESGRAERHFALPIVGQAGIVEGPSLGLLAVRCARQGVLVWPLTLSIVDNVDDVPLQSGPQRFSDEAA